MSTELAETRDTGLISEVEMQAVIKLDETVQESRRMIETAEGEGNQMLKGMIVARAMQRVRDLLTPEMMRDVMQLAGSPLGFRTDRDNSPQPYKPAEVADCLIVALMRGFQPVNNEFNIIGGNFYAAKSGLERVVGEWPGLTNLRLKPGVPITNGAQTGALVPFRASWEVDGTKMAIDCIKFSDEDDQRICVRVNKGQGADAILGKARRKMLARIYERLTGSEISEGDVDDPADAVAVEPQLPQTAGDRQRDIDEAFGLCNSTSDCNTLENDLLSEETLTPTEYAHVSVAATKRREAIRASYSKEAAQAAG